MADRMDAIIQEQNTFIAVGALHLPGEDGLIEPGLPDDYAGIAKTKELFLLSSPLKSIFVPWFLGAKGVHVSAILCRWGESWIAGASLDTYETAMKIQVLTLMEETMQEVYIWSMVLRKVSAQTCYEEGGSKQVEEEDME